MSRKGLNIYKRKDGRWEARYIKSRNALGKPKYGYLYPTRKRWDITKRLLNSIVQSRHPACMTRRWMSWTAWHGTTGSKRGGENDGWTNHGGVWYLSGAGCCFIGRGRERSAAQKEENGAS